MPIEATIPQTPASTVQADLQALTVHFTYKVNGGEPTGEHFHVPVANLPPALVTWIEGKIKARLERTA